VRLAFAAFVLAALLAAYVLLRPRWRWDDVRLGPWAESRPMRREDIARLFGVPAGVSNAPSVSSSSDPFARPFGETWRS